jgi:succinylarginine dihydrolase
MALSNNELSFDTYPSLLPMPASAATPVSRTSGARNSAVASVRKSTSGAASSARKSAGASSKWAANSSSLSASTSSTSGPIAFTGARNLVFMVGGLCYAEMRVSREVMEQTSREIILGSTSFLSANDFLDDLAKLCR